MSNDELVQEQNNAVEVSAASSTDEIDQLLESIPDEKPAAEDMLAAFFERHRNAVMEGIKRVSQRGLKRVMVNVALGEFAPKEYNPKGEDERKLAFHFNECVTKRGVLRLNEEFKRLEAAFEKEQEDLKKINQMTQDSLSPEAKQMIAESGEKIEIQGE